VFNKPVSHYPYSRAVIYVLLIVPVIWIAVSVLLSVGYAVFWEMSRESVIPNEYIERIQSQEQASVCLKGIELFQRELQFNVRRFLSRYGQERKKTLEVWEKSQAEWLSDFLTFGERYGFHRNQDELGALGSRLAENYRRLKDLQSEYDKEFKNLLNQTTRQRQELEQSLRSMAKEWHGEPGEE